MKENGAVGVKVYYQTPTVENIPRLIKQCPIYAGGKTWRSLLPLIDTIEPSMKQPYEVVLNFLDSYDETTKPSFHLLAVDVTSHNKNRFKVGASLPQPGAQANLIS